MVLRQAPADEGAGSGAARAVPRGTVAAHLGLLLCMACWGAMTPIIYVLLRTWDPYTVATSRYVLAVPVLLALLQWRERPAWTGLPWRKISLLGGIGIGGLALSLTLGLAYCDPISGIVMQAAGPAVAVFVARAMFGEALPRGIGLGLVLAVAGALMAMVPPGDLALPVPGVGELLILLSTVCWAWYSLACQRWLAGFSQLRITALTALTGGLVLTITLAIAIGAGVIAMPGPGGPAAIALTIFSALASTCLGILLWNNGVKRLGLTVAALYLNLAPVFAVIASLALGMAPSLLQLLGGLVVLAGIAQLRLWAGRETSGGSSQPTSDASR